MNKMLVFGKFDPADIKMQGTSLANMVTLETKKTPHTFGRHTADKTKIGIIERLINKVMRSGQGKRKLSGKYIRGRNGCGKKIQATQIVEDAFDIVFAETKQNPIQVLIKAIENAGPREDTTRIKRGGVTYTVSVDVSPRKSVDEALKNIALAAFSASFNSRVKAEQALAKEIILAAREDNASFSIKRRDEMERIAKSSR